MEPLGVNGKAEQLASHIPDLGRKLSVLEILGNKGVVCRVNSILQGEIETRRRLAGTGNAYQGNIGSVPVLLRQAIVVLQSVIYCVDTLSVPGCMGNAVRESHVFG